jgi:hypothetical protein
MRRHRRRLGGTFLAERHGTWPVGEDPDPDLLQAVAARSDEVLANARRSIAGAGKYENGMASPDGKGER